MKTPLQVSIQQKQYVCLHLQEGHACRTEGFFSPDVYMTACRLQHTQSTNGKSVMTMQTQISQRKTNSIQVNSET